MKSNVVFLTDLFLIPLFVLTLYTGMELHIAGHYMNHYIWHNWAVFHSVVSVLFSINSAIHIKEHWGWYKGIKNRRLRNKNKVTLGLSCTFIAVAITGILLLVCIDGSGSPVGLLHYIIGILIGVLGIMHIFKRLIILCKGVRLAFHEK